ncbi:MAG TPA: D-alanyl-D-alanine carboxypeptidase/D-alanyl-D-alanine-endopeptidase [Planctomycetaceae bacterium]|nr:D-alanyl-D-alanine carboxypeptidase/D-alanyl-D-alanine-endopeptidase [Planctomycetaceae bacterium]
MVSTVDVAEFHCPANAEQEIMPCQTLIESPPRLSAAHASRSHWRRILPGVCLLIACLGADAALVAGDRLGSQIGEIINASEFKQAHWGILVVDLAGGQTVFELNADRLFAPASVTKLFSTAAALDGLGAEYRFVTPIVRRGEVDPSGELKGDLILIASGDPSLGGRTTAEGHIAFTNSDHTYANGSDKGELTECNPLDGLGALASQVAKAGIKRVRGEVLVDDRLFEKEFGTGSGPRRLTPIMINDNLIDLMITPSEPGKPAKVTWRPESAVVQVDARVDTVAAGEPVVTTIRAGEGRSIILTGKIPAGHKPLVRVYEVADAAAFARGLLIEELGRAGIAVDASPLAGHPQADLPPREVVARLPRVARYVSPPFSESACLILKVSHNLHASTLPLLLAARKGKRTLEEGLRLQHEFLAKVGVDVNTISFGGGAGGAQADLVTPRATVQLLRYMHTRPDASDYKSGLPILGMDGTLSDVVAPESPARGKVLAKTGTYFLENVMNNRILLTSKALAGYMTDCTGRGLAFALFVNNVHLEKAGDTGRVGKTLGKLSEVIYQSE